MLIGKTFQFNSAVATVYDESSKFVRWRDHTTRHTRFVFSGHPSKRPKRPRIHETPKWYFKKYARQIKFDISVQHGDRKVVVIENGH